ncbi:paraquat-inducible protein A [Histidinibacterium aquaticum]|uniref:Paraquat-inducible membrane protein A n=1 Tax=Histidinibacterium aquaticum TaxID=2613962 RepID=A0A5J5GJB6_9RHOB|nr:paraquat-inducible protein A [Histidinibacterium aquaticum]KAA9007808.1 paraquat-inducible membrane protein A [Histidinibacterium aquaticum]
MEIAREKPVLTAREAGLVGCTRCARVWPMGRRTCGRCGSPLHSRDTTSLQRVWAWWIAGVIAYIPANLYPMLVTRTLLERSDDTIVGGAVELASHGDYGVAAIILIASVLIPVGKFLAIAYLAISVHRGSARSLHAKFRLYEVVEFIGRWSMIDVFVVAILSSLVQLSVVASIRPGPAALTFALSVIFTMLSAQSFDTRLIWDGGRKEGK